MNREEKKKRIREAYDDNANVIVSTCQKNLIQGHKTKMMTTICEIPSAEPSSKKKKKSMKIIDK